MLPPPKVSTEAIFLLQEQERPPTLQYARTCLVNISPPPPPMLPTMELLTNMDYMLPTGLPPPMERRLSMGFTLLPKQERIPINPPILEIRLLSPTALPVLLLLLFSMTLTPGFTGKGMISCHL